jgi:uncharacterized glyoxalase superfamily protein PhnB
MSSSHAPNGTRTGAYPAIVPYLTVADAKPLMAFLEQAFGAVTRFTMPSPSGGVMHAELALGDSLLMLSDAAESPQAPTHLCHYVPDTDAVYARAMAAGAAHLSAPETKEYGDRIAGVQDPAGNVWWICTRLK